MIVQQLPQEENKCNDATWANSGFEFQTIIFEFTWRFEKSCEIFLLKALKKKTKDSDTVLPINFSIKLMGIISHMCFY